MVWPRRRDRGPGGRAPDGVTDEGAPDTSPEPARTASGSPVRGERGPSGPLSDPGFVGGLRPIPVGAEPGATQPSAGMPACDIRGTTPAGGAVAVDIGKIGATVLLAFLATRCDGCDAIWVALGGAADEDGTRVRRQLPPGVSPVVVTRRPPAVAPEEVGRLAQGLEGVPVVMSDQAWSDYRVLGYPFFVLVDGASRTVVAETVGFGWEDIVEFVRASVG